MAWLTVLHFWQWHQAASLGVEREKCLHIPQPQSKEGMEPKEERERERERECVRLMPTYSHTHTHTKNNMYTCTYMLYMLYVYIVHLYLALGVEYNSLRAWYSQHLVFSTIQWYTDSSGKVQIELRELCIQMGSWCIQWVWVCICVYLCVFVTVRERERERMWVRHIVRLEQYYMVAQCKFCAFN